MATINNYCLAPPERRQKWYVSGVRLRERDAWAIGPIDGYRPRFLVKAEKIRRRDGDYRQLPAIPWKAAGLVYVGAVFSGFGEIVL